MEGWKDRKIDRCEDKKIIRAINGMMERWTVCLSQNLP